MASKEAWILQGLSSAIARISDLPKLSTVQRVQIPANTASGRLSSRKPHVAAFRLVELAERRERHDAFSARVSATIATCPLVWLRDCTFR